MNVLHHHLNFYNTISKTQLYSSIIANIHTQISVIQNTYIDSMFVSQDKLPNLKARLLAIIICRFKKKVNVNIWIYHTQVFNLPATPQWRWFHVELLGLNLYFCKLKQSFLNFCKFSKFNQSIVTFFFSAFFFYEVAPVSLNDVTWKYCELFYILNV